MEKSFIVKIKDANVYLGGNLILKDINWRMRRGEHWFMLGANGAGKTTLVKTLLGYAWPKFGARVEVLGKLYGTVNLKEVRERIAWVSPFIQQWTSSRWTALEMVISGLDSTLGLFREPEQAEKDRALQVMARLDCARLAEHKLETLSSGEQVKILICRALMKEPELMILDEPCVHLDMKSREFLLETIDELARRPESPTMLFITQRIEDVLPVFDCGLILKEGRIMLCGERDELLTEEHLQTAFEMPIRLEKSKTGRMWPVLI